MALFCVYAKAPYISVTDMINNPVPVTNCCAIILAAGQSARMGAPKQLLRYQGKTLLQHAIDAAKGANIGSVIVVFGSNMPQILDKTDVSRAIIVENTDWRSGMASSIVSGIRELNRTVPPADGALLMVCDQPFVSSLLLSQLIAAQQESGKPVAASKYNGIMGVPAVFHKCLFDELLNLKGDQGARKIIQRHSNNVAAVDFPEGGIDIDTIGDHQKLV
jgi:molybdenum cofactor cytidylyltransferase